ncbi:MAG: hypothetical protein GY719_33180 [bacterium]|nr:hypothetical protein [bacterium]
MTETSPERREPRASGTKSVSLTELVVSLRWPLVILALALIAYLAVRETLSRAERAAGEMGDLVGAAAERAEDLARGFLTGNITETFIAAIPEIDATGGGNLELAKAEVVETFRRSDERLILWDSFSLGTTISEIKVPVTYRYHMRLDDPWRLEVSGQVCRVYAPQVRPTQPPAIHTDRMEKRTAESWLRFDADEQLAELEKSITPKLIARARDPRHLALVRDQGRRTVAEFVRNWLLREDQWRDDRFHAIQVIFPDEQVDAPESLDVTIRLDDG